MHIWYGFLSRSTRFTKLDIVAPFFQVLARKGIVYQHDQNVSGEYYLRILKHIWNRKDIVVVLIPCSHKSK